MLVALAAITTLIGRNQQHHPTTTTTTSVVGVLALSPRRTSVVQQAIQRSLNLQQQRRRQGESPVLLSPKEQQQLSSSSLHMGGQWHPQNAGEEMTRETATDAPPSSDHKRSDASSLSTNAMTVITKKSRKSIVAIFAVTALPLTTVLAKIGLLPATILADGTFVPYTNAMLLQDIGLTLLTGTLGFALVQTITSWTNLGGSSSSTTPKTTTTQNRHTTKRWMLEPSDSRKLIHTLSAPLFMIFWPAFSSASIGARVFAAIVPLINAVRLYMAATSSDDSSDDGNDGNELQGGSVLAKAVSRSGDRLEAAGGPLIYVLVLAACILVFWRESAAGVVALSAMAAGDGVADLVGRRLGSSNPWPEFVTGPDNRKSIAGTVAFLVACVTTAAGLLWWFHTTGCLELAGDGGALVPMAQQLVLICSVAAVFELLPIANDNYSVPLSAALVTILLWG